MNNKSLKKSVFVEKDFYNVLYTYVGTVGSQDLFKTLFFIWLYLILIGLIVKTDVKYNIIIYYTLV